jgi:peptidoglycan/xylan/chitin deacetylase (PgdA/CDA1 family)
VASVFQTGRVRSEERRRRVPIRYIVVIVVVALVAGSERWDGPFTFEALQRAGASATGVAEAEPVPTRVVGEIHLTFDDGPHVTWTPQILDVLAEHGATATFFPIGNQVEGGQDLMRRAVAEGHRIGNHTWDHDRLVRIDEAAFDGTVGRTTDAIRNATGLTPTCLRPPQGVIDEATRSLARSRGLTIEMWTIDPQDWNQPGSRAIVDAVVDRVTAGDVVLLHDGGGDRSRTVRALDRMLDRLDRAGFRFTALPGC